MLTQKRKEDYRRNFRLKSRWWSSLHYSQAPTRATLCSKIACHSRMHEFYLLDGQKILMAYHQIQPCHLPQILF